MASSRIKGITIDIGGDTTGLDKALSAVDGKAKELQKELKEVDKALKLDPTNVELMAQKQQLLAQTVSETAKRLDVLKQSQSQVEAQFARGDIGAEQYRAFQRELATTEASLNSLSNEVLASQQNQNRLIQSTRDFNTLLGATGTFLDDYADVLGTRLTNAIRNGTATTDQMTRAIRLVGQSAIGSSTDIEELNRVLRSASDATNFDRVTAELRALGNTADDAGSSVDGLGKKLTVVAAGGTAAVAGLGLAIKEGLDMSRIDTQIEMSMSLNESDTAAVKESIRTVTTALGDEEAAYEGIRRQMTLNKDASVETNQEIIQGATAIAFAFKEIDFKELIQETHEMAKTFGITQQEAVAMTNSLLKAGFPPEQLDIISEYGNQLKMAGFNAEEIQGIMAAGVDTGTWNIDILLDGVKEGRIVMAEFGAEVDDSMKEAIKGTDISAKQLQIWGKAVAEGGEGGTKAMQAVAKAVSEIDDQTKQNEVGVKVFGTLWEENGTNITDTLLNMNDHMVTTADNMKGIGEATETMNADPMLRLSGALDSLMLALQPTLEMLAEFTAKVADMVTSLITGGEETSLFADAIQNTFQMIKDFVEPIITTFIEFVKEQFASLKAYWDENGAQILDSVKSVFEGIMTVVEFVMPAVKAIIEFAWESIKQIITGALDVIMGAVSLFKGIFTGDFEMMWEGIKQIFSGAIDVILGWMNLSFIGGIRTLLVNFTKAAITTIKGMWDNIVKLFSDMGTKVNGAVNSTVSSVISFFKNLGSTVLNILTTLKNTAINAFNAIKSGVTNAVKSTVNAVKNAFNEQLKVVKETMTNVKDSIVKIWNEITTFIKGKAKDFVQVGKDLISGLIKGIKEMSTKAIEAVTGVVDGVVNKAKDILGIASPSKVFKEIGLWTGEGMAIGLNSSSDKVNKSMENIGDGIIDTSEKFQKEYTNLIDDFNTKNENKEDKTLAKIQKIRDAAAKKKRALTKNELQQIALLEAEDKENMLKAEREFDKKYLALVTQSEKEYLNVIKNHIAEKKSLEEISLAEEAAIWQQSAELFMEGTNERLYAQQQYLKSVESLNKEVMTVNEKYTSEMMRINDNYQKQEMDLTKKYESTLENRIKALQNFAGTFDEFDLKTQASGEVLLQNLNDQVDGFKEWQKEIETLSERAIDKGLVKELVEMGPKALKELRALNTLTDAQLSEYSTLYQEKSELARVQAEAELSGMKGDTQKQIDALRTVANTELSKLENDWVADIKKITSKTSAELKTLESIGRDAVSGLINGIASMDEELQSVAQMLADTIVNTTKSALDIHSPSRVMRSIGEDTGKGLAIGMEKTSSLSVNAARNNVDSVLGVYKDMQKEMDWLSAEQVAKEKDLLSKRSDAVWNKTQIRKQLREAEEIYESFTIEEKLRDSFSHNSVKYDLKRLKDELREAELLHEEAQEDYDNFTKSRLDSEKTYVAEKLKLNDLSLAEEISMYKLLASSYGAHTEGRLYYDDLVVKSIDKVKAKEEQLTKAYNDAVNSRAQSIEKFAGLFDKVEMKSDVTGEGLLDNLKGQLDHMENWSQTMQELASKGINEGLLDELQQMGPNALAEMMALNSLSAEQLEQYQQMWAEKSILAREAAEQELIGMKEDTEKQIADMNAAVELELNDLVDIWQSAGTESGNGLIQGLQSKTSEIIGVAQSIADAVADTIQKALDINSPSRIMKGFGKNVGEGLIIGMDDMLSQVSAASSGLSDAIINAQSSLNESAYKTQAIGSNMPSTSSIDNRKSFAPNVTIYTTESPERVMQRELKRMAILF